MKVIPLTKGKLALVGDQDYDRVNNYKWRAWWDPKVHAWYAVRTGQIGTGQSRKRCIIYLARYILGFSCQPEPYDGRIVDHVHHDNLEGAHSTLDNRRNNLREATAKQNSYNRRKRLQGINEFKGINYSLVRAKRGAKPYRAYIVLDQRFVHLGMFSTAREAALAYDEAAVKYHGIFAKLNFPKSHS